MRSLAGIASTLTGVNFCTGSSEYVMILTVIDIYASAACITGTAASPFLTTALLPHRDSSDSGSEYRGRCEELLHGYRVVAEIRFLRRSLVRKQILQCCIIYLYKAMKPFQGHGDAAYDSGPSAHGSSVERLIPWYYGAQKARHSAIIPSDQMRDLQYSNASIGMVDLCNIS